MTELIPHAQYRQVQRFKQLLSAWQRNRDLVSVGAYVKGSDALLDQAIERYPSLEAFLHQAIHERSGYEEAVRALSGLFPNLNA